MGGIIWLASYPKSGNTWMRAFFTNFFNDSEESMDINDLSVTIASSRTLFDEIAGVEASDLTEDEIERLRPDVYEQMAAASDEETLFLKIHDAYIHTTSGHPLVPHKATRGVIYIIRNPFDTAVSFASHLGDDIDAVISGMSDVRFAFYTNPNRLEGQLRQRLLSWSGHVLSWVDAPGLQVYVMRYEDMKQNPLETFTGAVRFVGLANDEDRIRRALAGSDFKKMKQQEEALGFRERSPNATSFFRKGEVGSWRESLSQDHVARLVHDHRAVMERFGYLTENDVPVF